MDYLKDLAGRFKFAPQVTQIIKIFRIKAHKNLEGEAPRMCAAIQNVREDIVNQALSKYIEKSKEKDVRTPHPNYFITTCLNKQARLGDMKTNPRNDSDDEPPIIMGKTII